jgi:hypothetical protein
LTQAFDTVDTLPTSAHSAATAGGKNPNALTGSRGGSQTAYEGKASYEWTGDVAGKVWASAISQNVDNIRVYVPTWSTENDRATAWDLGGTVNVAGFGLTGYYGQGKGIGQTHQLYDGFDESGKRRDSDQWYVQGTYTIPGAGTKLGVSYGESNLEGNRVDGFKDLTDSMWTVGAYHPITKHLNLVAEYSAVEREYDWKVGSTDTGKAKTVSLGAILFF